MRSSAGSRQPHRSGTTWTKLILVAYAPFLAACSSEPPQGTEDAPPATPPTFRAALLTGGPVGDAGWYAGAYEGLLMLRDSLGAGVSHRQTGSAVDVDQAFASFASAGYDLIFAHGFEYQEAAIRAGARFPATTFVVSGGGQASANVVPLVFRLEEGSYLAGMVAAGVSATGVLGMVGGVDIPSVRGTFRAFEAGARVVRPDVRVLESFIGNWDDVGAAKDSAAAMLLQGADVLIHNTDAASFGVFQAVREAVEAGDRVWALGMNSNQNEVAPEVTLGSAVIRIPQSFLETARAWQAGTLGGAPLFAGARDDVIDFVVNPALVEQIPPDLLVRVREARDRIRSGDLEVPRVPFVEGEPGAGPPTGGTPGA